MPKQLALPPHLLNEIEAGNVTLFLGAGASAEAMNSRGEKPPLGAKLAKIIAQKFLPKGYEKLPLADVAAYAISQSNLFAVQDFVVETFSGFVPTDSHHKMKEFRWKGIATTNYDTIVEATYQAAKPSAAQSLVTFIDHSDRPDEQLATPNSVLYLKLHGCITRPHNDQCPLILTTEHYNDYLVGRERLFGRLFDWAAEKPILFVGHGLKDADLLAVLKTIRRKVPSFARSFLISPGIDQVQTTFWNEHRITAIAGTFDDLAAALDKNIGHLLRGIRPSSESNYLAVRDHFVRKFIDLPFYTTQFLERDVDYVRSIVPQEQIDPKQFYKGFNVEWSAIDQNLDVRRHLGDQILSDQVLVDEESRKGQRRFIVIKAHAGAGKTVLLQRLAWDAARDYGKLCLAVKPGGTISPAALNDLVDQTHERIFLFVDDVIAHRRQVVNIYDSRNSLGGNITIIAVARTNEWNTAPEVLTSLATDVYELKSLSHQEVDKILQKLEEHDALGTLETKTQDQRRDAFLKVADRQLLVALHEATHGESFEDIIANEYETITPFQAQQIYLSVCLLHRFGVPVRAGIISRMHGISFEKFQLTFFKPLEQIIRYEKDFRSNDMCYMSRHQHIAEIVVKTVLCSKEDLYNAIHTALAYLNPSYSSDQVAFKKLLNGRTLLEEFADHEKITRIFATATEVSGEDADLIQQQCIYEMNRPHGDLALAESLINKAIALKPRSQALPHTKAELFLRRAETATTEFQRDDYLSKAMSICELIKRKTETAYPYYTLIKIRSRQIKELRESEHFVEELETLIRIAQKTIREGIAKFPDNSFIRNAEAEFASVLKDHQRAVDAMERSFDLNAQNPYIATRLAQVYIDRSDTSKAVETLRRAIAAKPSDRRLRATLARTFVEFNISNSDELIYHLERSFDPGDNNLESRLLLARQFFLSGRMAESDKAFKELRDCRMPPDVRHRLRFATYEIQFGEVNSIETSYVIIKRKVDSIHIYCNRDDVKRSTWNRLTRGCHVSFKLAFCMNGARAINLEVA